MSRTYKKNRKKLSLMDKAYKSYSIQFSTLGNKKDEQDKPLYTQLGRRLNQREFKTWVEAWAREHSIDLNDADALLGFARNRAARDYNLITTDQAKNLKRELVGFMSDDEVQTYFKLSKEELKKMSVAELRLKAYNDKNLLKNYYKYLREAKGKTAEDAAATISAEIYGS